jgi:glycosyltransferase involved in cell wall biosynthesis
MNNFPKISVITVSYNQGQFIKDNIESIIYQNYPNFEHIIIDGGSTDNTLEILKSYKHLNWVSEPDRGQSHGLNKGFKKATGDIIVWLNSDDWLAPDTFNSIIEPLTKNQILLADSVETDNDKNFKQIIKNTPRSPNDLLRYWIPNSYFSQVSVFFTKEALDSVRLENGDYIDESLYFCMDFDFFYRLGKKWGFNTYLEKTCAYFRVSDENKTGANPLMAQKELTRFYRRNISGDSKTECELSIIVPVKEVNDDFKQTIDSLLNQTVKNFEVIVVDYSGRRLSKEIRNYAWSKWESQVQIPVRYESANTDNLYKALNFGVLKSCGSSIYFAASGDRFTEKFTQQISSYLSIDWIGLVIPASANNEIYSKLLAEDKFHISLDSLFSSEIFYPNFLIRKIAFNELEGFRFHNAALLSIKDLIIRFMFLGWHGVIDPTAEINSKYKFEDKQIQISKKYSNEINIQILFDVIQKLEQDKFSEVKIKSQIIPEIPETLKQQVNQLIGSAAILHSL